MRFYGRPLVHAYCTPYSLVDEDAYAHPYVYPVSVTYIADTLLDMP